MKITLFPHLPSTTGQGTNPYIRDFQTALEQTGMPVVNPAHKNPLLSLLPPQHWGDTFIFNWFESIPDFKYGPLQACIAACFLIILKCFGKRIVWVLHNQKPHADGHRWMKRFLSRLMARNADLIVTHATDGVELVRQQYPRALSKTHFLHHPTKNRIPQPVSILPSGLSEETSSKTYDLLIWGNISPYKGVTEFVDYLRQHPDTPLRVCIAGRCTSPTLYETIRKNLPAQVTFLHQTPSFETLETLMQASHFVLAPYCPESVLSSGILMDSLSYGCKVIGPAVGSFKDYAQEPLLQVYTFQHFDEIPALVTAHRDEPLNLENYTQFLMEHDWNHFVQQLAQFAAHR